MGYKSDAQRKAVHASKADGGKGAPSKMYKKKSPAKKPLVGKQKNLPEHLKKKILASPTKMNRYDKDMMHERELIYDAKKEIHKEDMAKKKSMAKQNKFGGKKSKQDMIDDKAMNFLSSPSSPKSDNKQKKFNSMSPSKMSAELKYMPVVDREKSTMSAIGAHKVLKHMKGRM
jgi:hypothetical protein